MWRQSYALSQVLTFWVMDGILYTSDFKTMVSQTVRHWVTLLEGDLMPCRGAPAGFLPVLALQTLLCPRSSPQCQDRQKACLSTPATLLTGRWQRKSHAQTEYQPATPTLSLSKPRALPSLQTPHLCPTPEPVPSDGAHTHPETHPPPQSRALSHPKPLCPNPRAWNLLLYSKTFILPHPRACIPRVCLDNMALSPEPCRLVY